MSKKYSIFISSTYVDLKDYRKSIHDAIIKNGDFPVAMENFTASDKSQWEIISSLINDCDYYILILGFKYGSIDNESNLSYTEKEYDYAISNNKTVLSFLLDESFEIQKDKNLIKIKTFREKIKNKSQMIQECKDEKNVSSDIIIALQKQYDENPQNGWIRYKDYYKCKQKYKELSLQYDELINPTDLSDLSDLDDEIILTGRFDESYNNWYAKSTFKKIFLLVGKHIFDYFPEDFLFNTIIFQSIEFSRDRPEYRVRIDEKSRRKVRNKLKKLGLIMLSDITKDGITSIFWKITKKGKCFYNT